MCGFHDCMMTIEVWVVNRIISNYWVSDGKGELDNFLFFLFFLRQSLTVYISGCPGIHYGDQDGLELTEMCLTLPPKYWD